MVVWRRALAGSVGATMARLLRSRHSARTAALSAEVIALRVTVGEMRAALDRADARVEALAVRLAAAREVAAAPVQGPATAPPVAAPAQVSLEMPLVRLALARTAGLSLTREMAAALAAPDRGPDTATTEIVLADLPERPLLDPTADRDAAPLDHAAAAADTPTTSRRIA